ncbi:hypothetical protein LTR53_003441 [Teratosphaeriaceae sp. CCFEE 6253]|nr:hypothetical protein LTR53_003441 [Teratosphaeriaceae sp. CCFEE 6253]
MPLGTLPAELRLHIYSYLPELQAGHHQTVAPYATLTPGVCRASRWLRQETLLLHVSNAQFSIQADLDTFPKVDRVGIWLRALGDAIRHVRSINLSRHWVVNTPTRWEGHVGFYFRMDRIGNEWRTSAGTYPICNDATAMRMVSVRLLQHFVREAVLQTVERREKSQLRQSDVELIAAAMNVVATRPLSVYDTEQGEAGGHGQSRAWTDLERGLWALTPEPRVPFLAAVS